MLLILGDAIVILCWACVKMLRYDSQQQDDRIAHPRKDHEREKYEYDAKCYMLLIELRF